MTAEVVSVAPPKARPEPDASVGSDLIDAVRELTEAQPEYAKAAAYYFGEQQEFFASIRLRQAMAATGVLFNFNFAKLPVDAVAERLEIAGISVQNETALDYVNAEWDANQLDLFAPDIMQAACRFGDAYVFVWPSEDAENVGGTTPRNGSSPDSTDTSVVDIFYCSPRIMRVFYDDENEHEKKYAIKKWVDTATEYTFANLYYRDRIEKYMMPPESKIGGKQQQWERRLDPEDGGQWPLDNPFDEIPIFHFRNAFPYGRPEHADAYGPQDAIHKLVVSHMASVDYNAFPQRWALMDPAYDTAEAAYGDEGEFAFPINTGRTDNQQGDPSAQLTADPASVWFMKGIKQYGQFDPADPISFLRPFTDYIHAMAVITATPMHFLDPIVSNVSGESLRVIEAPFAKKVRKRQLSFGATWRDVWKFVLRLHGMEASVSIQVNWVPAATVNDLSTLQGQLIKFQLGVPARELLTELGYTPEQLDAWNIEIPPTPPVLMPMNPPMQSAADMTRAT